MSLAGSPVTRCGNARGGFEAVLHGRGLAKLSPPPSVAESSSGLVMSVIGRRELAGGRWLTDTLEG